jgi:hypothetical protein
MYINVWQHMENDKCNRDFHVNRAFAEIAGKKKVLVMGSEGSRELFNEDASELYGLTMKHPMYPKVKFVVAPNPYVHERGLGELRLALEKFAKEK